MPLGQYVAQPNEADGSGLTVVWRDEGTMNAAFNPTNGELENICFVSSSPNAQGWTWEREVHSDLHETHALDKPESWKLLAEKIRGEFQMIGERSGLNLYYEVAPYKCTAICQTIDNRETPPSCTTVVFEKKTEVGPKVLAFTLDKWYGPDPLIGQSLLIGQDDHATHFFPVTKTTIGPVVGAQMKEQLARLEKEGEDAHITVVHREMSSGQKIGTIPASDRELDWTKEQIQKATVIPDHHLGGSTVK
jgi:hypothetical protein